MNLGCLIQGSWERDNARSQIKSMNVKTPSPDQQIMFLSGGNQQKAILGRWLSMPMKVLLLDEPTRGIDVGAKSEIYEIIHNLAADGIAVIVVSSDLMEVMGISDRILVMSEGAITGELNRDEADESRLLQLALPRTRADNRSLTMNNKKEVRMSTESSLQAPRQGMNLRRFVDDWVMLLAAVGIFLLCAVFIDNFMSPLNMRGLGLAISTVGIAACTMLYCLASGHFDLSIGSVLACSGVIASIVIRDMVGLINGIVIAKLRINALIATLATMQIVRGLAYIFSNGKAVGVSNEDFFIFGNGQVYGVPVPILITIACFIFFGWLLNYTTYGRNTMAIGGNQEAALLAGVHVDRTKIIIFAVHGLIGALAGVVLASRMTSGQPMIGQGFELTVISACVLGGVSLSGGIGMIRHVIAGVLILAIIENAMNLKNIDTFYQYVIRGTILLLAVIIDRMKRR